MEHGGFYRTTDQSWVTIERIQFVGACNPPTDPGRKPLSHRLDCNVYQSKNLRILLQIPFRVSGKKIPLMFSFNRVV